MLIYNFSLEVYNQPFTNPEYYPYDDFKSAYKAYKNICKDNQVDTFEGVLDKHYHRTYLPVEGGLVAKADKECLTGYTYGICHEGYGYFVGLGRLEALELNPTTDLFWSFE